MTATFKELAASVREVWSPPAGRPWSPGVVRIVRLLKAIEDQPDVEAVRAAAARRGMLEGVLASFDSMANEETFDPEHRRAAAWAADSIRREFKLQLEGATWQ